MPLHGCFNQIQNQRQSLDCYTIAGDVDILDTIITAERMGQPKICQTPAASRTVSPTQQVTGNGVPIDQSKKSHNAYVAYPIMHHSEQKCAHFSSEWSILLDSEQIHYEIREIGPLVQHGWEHMGIFMLFVKCYQYIYIYIYICAIWKQHMKLNFIWHLIL